jgi:hypothetical protein
VKGETDAFVGQGCLRREPKNMAVNRQDELVGFALGNLLFGSCAVAEAPRESRRSCVISLPLYEIQARDMGHQKRRPFPGVPEHVLVTLLYIFVKPGSTLTTLPTNFGA